MKYCENCKALCDSEYCSVCGNGELRDVRNDDFCFLMSCEETFGEMLELTLKEMNINCALVPFGNGARSAFGLSLGNYKVYVPYGAYEQAKDVVNSFIYDPTSDLKEDLLKNTASWHVKSNFALKKMRKKLKLTENDDLFDYVREVVSSATNISDGGPISSCTAGGHYISIKVNDRTIWFNSATYEIFM